VHVKTTLGWTPLVVADGFFCCNAKMDFPAAAASLRKAMAARGLAPPPASAAAAAPALGRPD
jgi:hypothetical protein